MLDLRRLFGLVVLLLLVGCGGDEDAAAVPLSEATGTGIVVESSGVLEPVEGLGDDQGKLIIEAALGSEAVTDKLSVKLSPVGAPETESGSGPGAQEYTLPVGEYTAALVYTQSEELGAFEGSLSGLEVRPGQATRYKVQLTVPLGILTVRFKLLDRNKQTVEISPDVKLVLYKGGDDPTLVKPTWEGRAGEELILPKGKYDFKATYAPGKGRAEVSEWHKGTEVGATLTRTDKEVVVEPEPMGVRIDAFNYSRDINAGTSVIFFGEGADMALAPSRAPPVRGGQVIEVPEKLPPGKYDVLLLYQPSPVTNPDLKIEKIINGFEVPLEQQAIRVPIDLETPLGVIRVRVMDGEENASDRIEMRVMRGGADPNAATPALEEFGVSEHFVPAGVYDIYFSWKKADGSAAKASFLGIELGNGYQWEQKFERGNDKWEAVPVRVPIEPLRPITWVEPGDDDDSAGDDDDSSAPAEAPAPPAE